MMQLYILKQRRGDLQTLSVFFHTLELEKLDPQSYMIIAGNLLMLDLADRDIYFA